MSILSWYRRVKRKEPLSIDRVSKEVTGPQATVGPAQLRSVIASSRRQTATPPNIIVAATTLPSWSPSTRTIMPPRRRAVFAEDTLSIRSEGSSYDSRYCPASPRYTDFAVNRRSVSSIFGCTKTANSHRKSAEVAKKVKPKGDTSVDLSLVIQTIADKSQHPSPHTEFPCSH